MPSSTRPSDSPPAEGAASKEGKEGKEGAKPAAPTDEELVARSRSQDFAAFEQLLDRYEDKIFRLAYRFVRNETEAKEILQDTFLTIWRKLDTFKGDAQFSSWLYRVATNAALMRLRAQRRHPEVSTEELPIGYLDSYGQLPQVGENWARRPDDELQSQELRNHIQQAVDGLPEIYRTVFLIRDIEGLSTEETAEVLQISIPTVKTRLHRARIALRDAIGKYFEKK